VDEEQKRQPWERQPWETPTAFRRFTDYYLSQPQPRSVDLAYRNYLCKKRGLPQGHESVNRKHASGTWRRWAQGRDRYDQKVPGGFTWPERGAAWDDHVAEQARAALAAREAEVLACGYALYFERIADLKALADLLWEEINTEKKRWLPDVKQIGSGEGAQRVDIVRFNAGLINEFRETLDDIAEELGQRVKNLALSGTVGVASVTADELAEARARAEKWRAERFREDPPAGETDG